MAVHEEIPIDENDTASDHGQTCQTCSDFAQPPHVLTLSVFLCWELQSSLADHVDIGSMATIF